MDNIFPGQPILLGQKQVPIDPWAVAWQAPNSRVARVVYNDLDAYGEAERLLPLPLWEDAAQALATLPPKKWARTFGHRLLVLMAYVRRATGTPIHVPELHWQAMTPVGNRPHQQPGRALSFDVAPSDPLDSTFRVWAGDHHGYMEIPLRWLYMEPDAVQAAAVDRRLQRLNPGPYEPNTSPFAKLVARHTLDSIVLGELFPKWPETGTKEVREAFDAEFSIRAWTGIPPWSWLTQVHDIIDRQHPAP